MQLAYVCAPLAGDIKNNIEKALAYSRQLVDFGAHPVSTHLMFDGVYDDTDPAQRKTAMEACLKMLEFCDIVVVFGDKITEGMALEIEAAGHLGIPVFYANARLKNKCVGIGT